MSNDSRPLHLAVALDGTGWHPASWREPDARPTDLLTARYWTDLVVAGRTRPAGLRHHRGRAHACSPTIRSHADDRRRPGARPSRCGADRLPGGTADPPHRPGADRGRHAHRAVPPLEGDRHARLRQLGPGGVRVQVTASARGGAPLRSPRHHARSSARPTLLAEAADYVEVLRRLWDSWEDDAEIRDVATGRFVDRDKLHYIDFEGASGSPSRGRRSRRGRRRASRSSPRWDTAIPRTRLIAGERRRRIHHPPRRRGGHRDRRRHRVAARTPVVPPVRVFADLVVFLDDTADAARARRHRLDDRAGANSPVTQRFSPAHRRSSPTCSRSGTRRARRDSGCVRPPCPMT